MKNETKAIHTQYDFPDAYGSLCMPVYHTAAYEFADAKTMSDAFCGRSKLPDYSRITNPTVIHFENIVRNLTGAEEVIALNSGMAAISNTLLALASSGMNIVTSKHLFGNTYLLISETLSRFGVEARFCDLTDAEEVASEVDDNTCCIYAEIISNPQMEVADMRLLSRIAHNADVPLVADTTMIPFTEFSARSLGIDIEVVSSTKYISGGATCIGGLVISYGWPGFSDRMKGEMLLNLGAYMTPHVAYMQTLGLESLSVRYSRQSASALALAQRLSSHPSICKVNHIGLRDNPFHDLGVSQYGPSCGAMLTIELESLQACCDFIDRLKVFRRATNLFDNRSLAIHPASTIFGNFTSKQREDMDIPDTLIRLSVGLEDIDDLYEDIIRALDK